MNLSAMEMHDIAIIAFALVLILVLYSLFSDTTFIALILFLILLAIMLM
jgi:hypothetical protein